MNSNQNKVVLFDIYSHKKTVINKNVSLQSNIIKSIYDMSYHNTISTNIYMQSKQTFTLLTKNLTIKNDLHSADMDTLSVDFSFGSQYRNCKFVVNKQNSYSLFHHVQGFTTSMENIQKAKVLDIVYQYYRYFIFERLD